MEAAILATSGTACEDKIGIMTTIWFQYTV